MTKDNLIGTPCDWKVRSATTPNMLGRFLFEELLTLALPIVGRFREDLYNDAIGLYKQLSHYTDDTTLAIFGDHHMTFIYSVREAGTHLFFDDEMRECWQPSWEVYRFHVHLERDGQGTFNAIASIETVQKPT